MLSSMTLTLQQYEALVALARQATADSRTLDTFLATIEQANGIIRDLVWVQWQEQGAPLPPGTSFPDTWPPQMRLKIELVSRSVARTDVEALLAARAVNPTSILVTCDPAGTLGYMTLDDFFSN